MEMFTLGRYSVLEELGRGGMGIVYRARDERLQRQVALKILPAGLRDDERSRTRLRREALAAAILNHPNIVSVLDFDESGGSCFIAYEYVEGKTLDRVLDRSAISDASAASIGRQLADALAYSHERGILHRDIKPQNIMLTPEGRAKLLDFGLARLGTAAIATPDGRILDSEASITADGTIVGTAAYMSPEQLTGETLDGRTDLFSLGVVLYEMLVGENPFRAPSFAGTVASIMAPDPPAIPEKFLRRSPGLSAIVNRCLQKPRDKRYPGARLLADDLAALAEPSAKSLPAIPPARKTRESGLIPRGLARSLISLLQFLYLVIYGVAIYKSGDVLAGVYSLASMLPAEFLNRPFEIASGLLITGCCGIPVRLYLLASIAFDDPDMRRNFKRLFPFLFVLDEIWALSPFLLVGKWPAGLTMICVALLAYLPITQRNLVGDACPEIQAR